MTHAGIVALVTRLLGDYDQEWLARLTAAGVPKAKALELIDERRIDSDLVAEAVADELAIDMAELARLVREKCAALGLPSGDRAGD